MLVPQLPNIIRITILSYIYFIDRNTHINLCVHHLSISISIS